MDEERLLKDIEVRIEGLLEKKARPLLETTISENLEPLLQKRFEAQEAKRFRQVSFLITILGVVGIGTMAGWVNNVINRQVEQRVNVATELQMDEMALHSFTALTQSLKDRKSWYDQEEDDAIAYLERFHDNPEIHVQSRFREGLATLLQKLASTKKSKERKIDRIFELYRNEVTASDDTLKPLIHHYGRRLASRNYTQENDAVLGNFEVLERSAADVGYPELPLLYRSIYLADASRGSRDVTVARMIEDASMMQGADQKNFLAWLFEFTEPQNWQNEPTQQAESIARKVRQYMKIYRTDLETAFSIDDMTAFDALAEGLLGDPNPDQYAEAIVLGETASYEIQ